MTERVSGSNLSHTISMRDSDRAGKTESGDFGGRKVTLGGVLKTIGRVLLGVATLGISELVIHLAGRKATTTTAPKEGARANQVLSQEQSATTRHKGTASREFCAGVEDSINDKFGVKGDLSVAQKFVKGVHSGFIADSNRATYKLNGQTLPRDSEAVVNAFREALSEEELAAVTSMLHQGASLSFIEQLIFSDNGPVKGQLGMPQSWDDKDGRSYAVDEAGRFVTDDEGRKLPGKESTYSLERTKEGVLRVTIEDQAQLQSSGLYDEDNMPVLTKLDIAKSSLSTTITGEIRPGEDPVFRLLKPIGYDIRLTPQS